MDHDSVVLACRWKLPSRPWGHMGRFQTAPSGTARGHQSLCGYNRHGKKSLSRDPPSHCSLTTHPPPCLNTELPGSHCHLPLRNLSWPSAVLGVTLDHMEIWVCSFQHKDSPTATGQKPLRKVSNVFLGNSTRTSMGHNLLNLLSATEIA